MAAIGFKSFRSDMGVDPIVEGLLPAVTPIYAERYLLAPGMRFKVRGVPTLSLVTLLEGAGVTEAGEERSPTSALPGQTMLVPPRCATQWRLVGGADAGAFNFLAPQGGVAARLLALAVNAGQPLIFFDVLVGCTARYVLEELQKGDACDAGYVDSLVQVMLEASFRALSTPGIRQFSPRHVHFRRLQGALTHIRANLSEPLSVQGIAQQVGVSPTHFRRLFQEATGVPVHRYVLAARLEKARNLLAMSAMPIAEVAAVCGFSSQSHLTASFRTSHGATPAQYRKARRA